MIVKHYEEVEAVEIMEGVKKRIVIGEKENAPNFIMRVFDVEPGYSSPYHAHPWEHEVFIMKGEAALKNGDGEEMPLQEGDTIFVPPMEKHSLINKGSGLFRFMCLIPTGAEN